jgi:ribosomal-protein-alanine acetyltransferase
LPVVFERSATVPITIQDASAKDLDRLHEIEKECFNTEAFTKRQLASLLAGYNTVSIMAKEKDTIIGFVIGTIEFEDDTPIGHVLTIDVSPSHRRRGVGLFLLESLEKISRMRKVKESRLEVRENNAQALSLYAKAGYERIGKLEGYYGHADGLLLTKRLH